MANQQENKEEETKDAETQATGSSQAGAAQSDDLMDLEDLDLTVETVEERISPSETNVFDK